MNKIYKVVKGKVCSEHAKGAKKGAVGFTENLTNHLL